MDIYIKLSHRAHHVFFRATFVISALVFLVGAVSPVLADGIPLAPQTKIRLTIVQWMPAKGQYERWDALGGEYTVSDEGAVSLPLLGSLSIGNLDNASLTSEIAKRLQEKIPLVQTPTVTVEIVEYPPIYVLGDATKPGEYMSPHLSASLRMFLIDEMLRSTVRANVFVCGRLDRAIRRETRFRCLWRH